MTNKHGVTIIIPAYNEEEGIKDVINGVKRMGEVYEIIVVDDCSTDNTYQLATEAGVTVIHHSYNKGMGAAIKTGARHATGDILVFMDGDGQHNPEYIPSILRYIGECDMVVGERTKESKTSFIRNVGNKVLILIANYLAGVKIPDLTSGFRAVKKEVFMMFIHLLPNSFSSSATITLALLQEGFNVKFVPIKVLKRSEKSRSKLNPLKDGFRFTWIIVRMIVLFEPFKIFLPISAILFLAGLVYLIYELVVDLNVPDSSVLLIIASIIIFFFGILADQVSALRRQIKGGGQDRD
jgi:glycosyltransferase involved in cell wall biosynthesis